MVLLHELLETLLEHVGVDFRRRDVRVPQQLLHRSQIGAAIEQVAGERVTQHVRADALGIESRKST